jgi:hypothetical protein
MSWLDEVLAREEIMEKQQSRIDRLRAGDRNSGFFHAKAKQHSHTNKIMHLKHVDGSLCMVLEEIEAMTTTFGKGLFTVQGHTSPTEVI